MTLRIGITGGIGSGKSIVCQIFHVLGVPIYDADSRAKWLMSNDELLIKDIKGLLGADTYNSAHVLDTKKVAAAVFNNESLLQSLNALVHPAVGRDFEKWAEQNSKSHYVVKEAALLFESGSYRQLDEIILVSSPLELRLKRIMQRDPFRSEAQIHSIINQQLPEETKIRMSNEVILNDEKNLLIPQVLRLHHKYSKKNGMILN